MKFTLPQLKNPDELIISFVTLRRVIGFLAFLLPPVLVLGSFILDGNWYVQVSMSAYYHTQMRDLFVGVICGISLFLFCYHGYKWYDSLFSKLAGLFALGIAFFPTSQTNDKSDIISILHYVTAGIFFVILAIMSLFLFTKSKGIKTERKKQRNRVYKTCGIIMLISVAAIPIADLPGIWEHIKFLKPTFVLETIALVSFGISWLTKGETILWDN